eukprot:7992293-Pyramimonas_sp.AAC.1
MVTPSSPSAGHYLFYLSFNFYKSSRYQSFIIYKRSCCCCARGCQVGGGAPGGGAVDRSASERDGGLALLRGGSTLGAA